MDLTSRRTAGLLGRPSTDADGVRVAARPVPSHIGRKRRAWFARLHDRIDMMDTSYPLLPLRDIVVFPGMVVPLFVGRDKSVASSSGVSCAGRSIVRWLMREGRAQEAYALAASHRLTEHSDVYADLEWLAENFSSPQASSYYELGD